MTDTIASEITMRLQEDIAIFDDGLPENYTIVWAGYIVGLLEWGLITQAAYYNLYRLLPKMSGLYPQWLIDRNVQLLDLQKPIESLQHRIHGDSSAFQGILPENYALAWHGYLAASLEWRGGVIQMGGYNQLTALLPPIALPNPVATIFSGRIYAEEIESYFASDMQRNGGKLPERSIVAWKAYLTGLWEYGAITPATYQKFLLMLPHIKGQDTTEYVNIQRGRTPKTSDANTKQQIEEQIRMTLRHIPNDLSDRYTITWKAYLISLRQWHIIQKPDYDRFLELLPSVIDPDPTIVLQSVFS